MLQLRVNDILRNAQYATISIVDQGKPWAYSVSFVRHSVMPDALVYYSHQTSKHTQAVQSDPSCALSIYTTNVQGAVTDGLQAEGLISIIETPSIELYDHYYNTAFTDTVQREEWRIPVEEFSGKGSQRFHIIHLERLWLMDLKRWEVDKADMRIEVSSPLHS